MRINIKVMNFIYGNNLVYFFLLFIIILQIYFIDGVNIISLTEKPIIASASIPTSSSTRLHEGKASNLRSKSSVLFNSPSRGGAKSVQLPRNVIRKGASTLGSVEEEEEENIRRKDQFQTLVWDGKEFIGSNEPYGNNINKKSKEINNQVLKQSTKDESSDTDFKENEEKNELGIQQAATTKNILEEEKVQDLIGKTVAIHNGRNNRFVRIIDDHVDALGGEMDVDKLPEDWTGERFQVVDAMNGEIALYNPEYKRWLRLDGEYASAPTMPSKKKKVVKFDKLKFASPPPIKKVDGKKKLISNTNYPTEKFILVDVGKNAFGNDNIGLYSRVNNRFLRLHDEIVDGSPEVSIEKELPADWTGERFSIKILDTDVDDKESSDVFQSGSDPTPPHVIDRPPPVRVVESTKENTKAEKLKKKKIEMKKEKLKDYPTIGKINDEGIIKKLHVNDREYQKLVEFNDELREKAKNIFKEKIEYLIGKTVGLHNEHSNRFVRLIDDGLRGVEDRAASDAHVDALGGEMDVDKLPEDWTGERFQVVDAMNGKIALYSPEYKRWLRLDGEYASAPMIPKMIQQSNKLSSPPPIEDGIKLISNTNYPTEKFTLVDVGGGKVALYSDVNSRFLRLHDGIVDGSPETIMKKEMPSDWTGERFTIQVLEKSQNKKSQQYEDKLKKMEIEIRKAQLKEKKILLEKRDQFKETSTTRSDEAKKKVSYVNDPEYEKLATIADKLREATKNIVKNKMEYMIGKTVAIHNGRNNRFVRIIDDHVDASPLWGEKDVDKIPEDWTGERFQVVDAMNGEIALYNPEYKRWLRLDGEYASAPMPSKKKKVVKFDKLKFASPPPIKDGQKLISNTNYPTEKFTLVDVGNDKIGLYSRVNNRFLRLHEEIVDGSPEMSIEKELPSDWTGERFTITVLDKLISSKEIKKKIHKIKKGGPLQLNGQTIGLYNPAHNRFIRMTNGIINAGGDKMNIEDLPDDCDEERFQVVYLGSGEIALFNPISKDWFKITDEPIQAERFTISYLGNNQIALHSRSRHKFLRVHEDTVDFGGGDMNRSDLPDDSDGERFELIIL